MGEKKLKKDRQELPVPVSTDIEGTKEAEVLGSVRLQVEAAWAEYGKRLYWFALTMVCSGSDAEDVLQNVFLGMVRSVERGGEIRNMRAYLYRAVRNEALRMKRMRASESSADVDQLPLLVEANQHVVEEAMDVSAALSKLPEQQREVVVLKLYHDMTFDEIANMAGISLNTAASRYRYGIEKMRRVMEARREV